MTRFGFLAVAIVLACPLFADDIGDSRRNAIVTSIERAAPAVVSVNLSMVTQRRIPMLFDEYWGLFDIPRPMNQVRKRRMNSVGSGFIFDARGYIITNWHVVEGATGPNDAISVTLPDGRELPVELAGADERTDVAVLRVRDAANLPSVGLGDSDDLLTGEWVIAIGNPFGTLMKDPQPTVSVGVVSANHRRVSSQIGDGERLYQGMIQTDAAINPGNSGGPLVNAQGRVVGVNTMIFSQSGGSVGLGFALPINRARRVAEEIIQYGRRRDPWAGFKVEDVQSLPPQILAELGVQVDYGCIVRNIVKGVPAHQAGLQPGDVIVGINNNRVENATDIDFVIWDLFVGDHCALTVNRQGKTGTVEFLIQELTR
ncbi:MAG: trypsin-like peptidase domain-containing protein [Candidatus Hydrogenedentes bacterium]|nr:trypsin-like peptidase domain-containing protein [Candidatus Hydrogenedentota bacterium]